MKKDNRTLVDLYREYINLNSASSQGECPTSDSLANSFMSSASIREKKKIVDHISHCRLCREEFLILLQFHQHDVSSTFDQDGRESKEHSNIIFSKLNDITLFIRFSCVFMGLLLITTSTLLILQNDMRSITSRSGDTGISLIYPITTHSKSKKLIFQWNRQPESGYYVLELFDEALMPLWTSQKAATPQIQIPDDVYLGLHIGKSYFWMVTGFSGDLKTDESPLMRFIIIDRP